MLKPIGKSRRNENNVIRQWFMNEEVDLILFRNPDQSLQQFQLSYDKLSFEKLLIWDKDHGFSHGCVDDGQDIYGRARAPVVNACDGFNAQLLSQQFKRACEKLSPDIQDFIINKLSLFACRKRFDNLC